MVPVTGRRWRQWGAGLVLALLILGFGWWIAPAAYDAGWWRLQVSPGPLTPAHAFIEHRCSACHVALQSVPAEQCIVCHANDTTLLQRQATAFHASIGACTDCHQEHRGDVSGMPMDHQTLARIGLRKLAVAAPGSEQRLLHDQLSFWLRAPATSEGNGNPRLGAEESVLDCKTCHASRDRHWGLFGSDCAQCHAATQWSIAGFRHPPPSSTDCVQCHQPPPSHSMGHFEMVSKTIAGEQHARVDQCYLCHQTTAWNDIRSAGVVKHH